MSPPKAVPFDVDGTLVDTVELHAQAWVETPQNFGIEADFTDIRLQIGKGGNQLLPGLTPPAVLEQRGEEIQEFRADLFNGKHMSRIKAFPGVREHFQRMKFSGQKTVLASSGQADEEATTNIADLIDGATTSDDAERPKPFPDIFEAAFGKLGLSERTDAMVVGDTPYDAEAARAAGLSTIGFLCGGSPSSPCGRPVASQSTATPGICLRATRSRPSLRVGWHPRLRQAGRARLAGHLKAGRAPDTPSQAAPARFAKATPV